MIQENELRDRRGTRRAVRCDKIFGVEKLESRAMARNLVRGGDQITRGICQSRSVKNLADVASRVGSIVMVQESDARRDVEQHEAAEDRERLARELCGEEPGW
jgi:hypothetical protein